MGLLQQDFVTLRAPLLEVEIINNQDRNYDSSVDVLCSAVSQALCEALHVLYFT